MILNDFHEITCTTIPVDVTHTCLIGSIDGGVILCRYKDLAHGLFTFHHIMATKDITLYSLCVQTSKGNILITRDKTSVIVSTVHNHQWAIAKDKKPPDPFAEGIQILPSVMASIKKAIKDDNHKLFITVMF